MEVALPIYCLSIPTLYVQNPIYNGLKYEIQID